MNDRSAASGFFGGLLKGYRIFRAIVLNLLFLILLLLLLTPLLSPSSLPIPPSAVLELAPEGMVVEQRSIAAGPAQLLQGAGDGEVLLNDLVQTIDAAAGDARIRAIVLRPDKLNGAFSHMQEIGRALTRFKAANKPLYALAGNYNQAQYYLASLADQVMLNPMGAVNLEGFGTWQLYFQQALEKLGIEAHIFRVGTYKAAVEPFERNDMSPEAKSNYGELFGDLWDLYLRDINAARNLPQNAVSSTLETLDEALALYQGDSAALALGTGLVDRVESTAASTAFIDGELTPNSEPLPRVDYRRYLHSLPSPVFAPGAGRIGLIVASGEIVDGEAMPGLIGGDTLSALIRSAREDRSLAALVLRVDSPGGSAFASELVRGELEAFKASGRPLVVSMGSMAASGGYWIATPADEIWASASTITGSIGIFGLLPTFDDSFARLGLHVDGIGTTSLSGAGTPGLPLSPLLARSLQLSVENGYQRFIGLVAQSRNMTLEAVDQVAQGQVWSGLHARELGLVDQLGDLDQALASAAQRAGVDDYVVVPFDVPLSPVERLLQQLLTNRSVAQALTHWRQELALPDNALLRRLQPLWSLPAYLNDPNALYLHCLVCDAARLQ
ncbi:MAG TPA: signal peptide peptidase SppA [Hyphomicrobiales bacterium]|nr:signal peptide peptidase SppA [Hyphomicrobiales bacterium]